MMSIGKVVSRFSAFTFRRSAVSASLGTASYSNQPLAVVTGGAQGIGFIVSDRLLREGYRVCLADIDTDKGKDSLAELQKKHGSNQVLFQNCDVTSKDSFEETFAKVKEHGLINLLVNNAGVVDEYDFQRAVAVNLTGTIFGCQLALQFMGTQAGGKGGTVINIGSIPLYVATKHGIIGLTRSYGDESHFQHNGVIFTAMCPLYVNTPLLYSAKPLNVYEHTTAMKYLEPDVVADGISKLLKDRINGSALLVLHEKMEYAEIPDQLKSIPFSR